MQFFSFDRPWVTGDELPVKEQRKALAQFVHRFTLDHKPAWAHKPRMAVDEDGVTRPYAYAPQFASDADWLAHTMFNVKKDGTLRKASCWSKPTWPLRATCQNA